MMLNVRGTHGSGKTTISRRLITEHPHEELVEPQFVEGVISRGKKRGEPYRKNFKKPNCFAIEGGLFVVGRWQSGMDGLLPHDVIEDLLRYWAPRGHLVYENVLLSGNVGRWGELMQELEPINHTTWGCLDTPAQLCLDRVEQRRVEARAAGFKHRQLQTNHDVHMSHWRRVRRVACQGVERGFDVRWLQHELAYEMAHDALVSAGWDCKQHGLLLPDGPFLEQWRPDENTIAQVRKTTKLPWLDEVLPWENTTVNGSVARTKPEAVLLSGRDGTGGAPHAPPPVTEGDPFEESGDPFDG